MSASLTDIRAEIDALDADLRALLLARADLVAQIAAAKTAAGVDGSPLRPQREMQQMQALLDWQAMAAPNLQPAGLLAIWREIIGMALAQQGGLRIFASAAAMPMAQAHFGASLTYIESDRPLADSAGKADALAVLTLAEAEAPLAAQTVLARLPVIGPAAALVYGAAVDEGAPAGTALVCRAALQAGDALVYQGVDYVLVETQTPDTGALWGRYLTLQAAS
jgi:chorismate mutase